MYVGFLILSISEDLLEETQIETVTSDVIKLISKLPVSRIAHVKECFAQITTE
jgi:hypothetical protein